LAPNFQTSTVSQSEAEQKLAIGNQAAEQSNSYVPEERAHAQAHSSKKIIVLPAQHF